MPAEERTYFHHGWTAMLVIFFIEGVTVLTLTLTLPLALALALA